ncbi:TPA: hypothetical protein R6335_004439 [Klebsiella pneumoniae]|nr:hypothetical protein [Klebsiella pneumoniae]
MGTRFVVNFDYRTKNDDIQFSQIVEHFAFIIAQLNKLFQVERIGMKRVIPENKL